MSTVEPAASVSRAEYFGMLFAYNSWANARILAAAARLGPGQIDTAPIAGHASLRATLVHALWGELSWRQRWEGDPPTTVLSPDELPTLEAVRERWQAEERVLRDRVATLDDAALEQVIPYRTVFVQPPVAGSLTLEQVLTHIALHGMQTRSEAAAMLTVLGQSPGNLDILFFFHEQAGRELTRPSRVPGLPPSFEEIA